jgi:hypothetical protein
VLDERLERLLPFELLIGHGSRSRRWALPLTLEFRTLIVALGDSGKFQVGSTTARHG